MIHIDLFLYLLSLVAAAASITGAMIFYFRYCKMVLVYYGMMLAVVTLLLLHRMTEAYCGMIHLEHFHPAALALGVIEKSAFITGIFAGPFFMHLLLGLELSNLRKRIYLGIAGVYTLCAIAEILLISHPAARIIRYAFSLPLLFGMYGYCLLMGILAIKKIASPLIKTMVMVLIAVSLAILPFSLFQYVTGRPYLPGFMERPLLFLTFFGLTILFTIKHFSHPAYLEHQKLTPYFKEHFSLTDRECEIVFQVIQGHSNQEIGDNLFISPRTVESHLYTIYQKLNVKNRVQLANLIQTNKQ